MGLKYTFLLSYFVLFSTFFACKNKKNIDALPFDLNIRTQKSGWQIELNRVNVQMEEVYYLETRAVSGKELYGLKFDSLSIKRGENLHGKRTPIKYKAGEQQQQIFIPFHTFLPGQINFNLVLCNNQGENLKETQVSIPQNPILIYRPVVKAVRVRPLNPKGEAWDLKVRYAAEAAPDLQWVWLGANDSVLYTSAEKRNVYEAKFEERPSHFQIYTPEHRLIIFDHDKTSRSDIIGELHLNPQEKPAKPFDSVLGLYMEYDTVKTHIINKNRIK